MKTKRRVPTLGEVLIRQHREWLRQLQRITPEDEPKWYPWIRRQIQVLEKAGKEIRVFQW